MELLPYIYKLWLGEGFDYNMPLDYWLIEISGIPFGLVGDMMCNGQPYRGLLFGMTARQGWVGQPKPEPFWALIDRFELADSRMIGFWDSRNNVVLSNPAAKATLYRKEDETFMVIANETQETIKTEIFLRGKHVNYLYAPELEEIQSEGRYTDWIGLEAG